MADIPSVPRDQTVRPSLEEVLELRRDRMATMREVVDGLTDEQLAGQTTPVDRTRLPRVGGLPVQTCVGCIVNEEWYHHQYAIRDLAVLEAATGQRERLTLRPRRKARNHSGSGPFDGMPRGRHTG